MQGIFMSPARSSDPFDNWTVQVRKGLLEFWVLRRLARGECYGYDLVKELTQMGSLSMSEGTVYPLLSRLRVQGWVETHLVESNEGPARKYYRLSAEGQQQLTSMNCYWDELQSLLEDPS